jgi:hypothetical protein
MDFNELNTFDLKNDISNMNKIQESAHTAMNKKNDVIDNFSCSPTNLGKSHFKKNQKNLKLE